MAAAWGLGGRHEQLNYNSDISAGQPEYQLLTIGLSSFFVVVL